MGYEGFLIKFLRFSWNWIIFAWTRIRIVVDWIRIRNELELRPETIQSGNLGTILLVLGNLHQDAEFV